MLKKLTIKGYKSIKSTVIELNKINILIGANGAGKSNLISFFKLLRWTLQNPGQLQVFISKSGGANLILFDGASVTETIQAELNFITNDGNRNDYRFRLSYAAGDTLIFTEECYRFSRSDFETLADWTVLDVGHKEAKLIERANFNDATAKTIFKILQSCPVYQFHNTSETARIRQKWSVEDNRYLREDAANLAPFLLSLRETKPIYYQRIVETLRQITPFFLNFVLEPEYNFVMLQWQEINTDLIFSSHQASDGTLRTMALVTLLLQPEENLPEVLILDEPELGLHPYAINILGGLINSVSNYSQIIVATQSTLLIDCFEPKDIIVVERNQRQSSFNHLNSLELQDWLEEYSLSELWNKNVIGGRPSK